MHSKIKGVIWVFVIVIISAALALGIPFFAKKIPWSFEERLANRLGLSSQFPGCLSKNTRAQGILRTVVQRIYPLRDDEKNLPPIAVDVVDRPEVNAVAMLGRRIYIFRGLIEKAETPEELVGVLAHEVEHIQHRHVIEAVIDKLVLHGSFAILFGGEEGARALSWFMDLKFSREKERQADLEGLKRLRAAKVNPRGIMNFFNRLEKESSTPDLISDHPSSADRAAWIEQAGTYPSQPVLTSSEWRILKTGCGAH